MMITMTRIKMNSAISMIRAFTLLESLLVLLIVSFITLFFSAELTQTVHLFKGELFVLQFENLYKISQENAALQSSSKNLESKNGKLIYENKEIDIPKEVEMAEFLIKFDEKGENSSLQKIKVYLPYEKKTILYQMEMGSGKYKKKIN